MSTSNSAIGTAVTVVGVVVVGILALRLIGWLTGVLFGIISFAAAVAIVGGAIWFGMQAVKENDKKKRRY